MMVSQELPVVQRHEKLIGYTLRDGEYEVRRLLGQGGVGTVFLAMHTGLVTPFALKQVRADSPLPEVVVAELDALLQGNGAHQSAIDATAAWTMPGSGGEQTDHFIREALFLARLRHPAIPTLYDYFFQDGYWYLVMDYIAGPTLRTCLNERAPLPTLEALGYAIQLCEVLDYLHKQAPAVIFRDLKPANVLLGVDGLVQLIDFGSACYRREDVPDGLLALGSPGYLAPEQCRLDDQVDARADLYSLGVILYEMLSGRRPSRSQYLDALHLVNPNVSHILSGLVRLATRPDPRQRFQSAYTFYLALERAYGIEERRAYQQFVITATAPETPNPALSTAVAPAAARQGEMVELSTREAFNDVSPSQGAAELEHRLALREALRQARHRRLAQEELESHLASVDESLKRRALSLSQSSLQAVTPLPSARAKPKARYGRSARKNKKGRRVVQVIIFLLLICFVVLTPLLVYLFVDHQLIRQILNPMFSPGYIVATPDIGPIPSRVVEAAEAFPSPTPLPGVAPPSWQVLSPLPVPAADNAAAYLKVGDRAYIYMSGGYLGKQAGGQTAQYDHHLYRYDIAVERWEVVSDHFPALVNISAAVDEQGHLFFSSAYSPDEKRVVSTLYRFTPRDKSLQKIVPPGAIKPGFAAAMLADQRGHLYLTQGFSRAGDPHAQAGTGWYRYDLSSGAWQTLAPLPRGLGYVALASDGGNTILLLGGSPDAGQSAPLSTIYRYDIAANAWMLVSDAMPRAFSGMAGCQIWPGQFVLVGGYESGGHVGQKTAWRLDIRTSHWQELPALPSGASLLGAAACDGRGHLFLTRGADDSGKPARDFWGLTVPQTIVK